VSACVRACVRVGVMRLSRGCSGVGVHGHRVRGFGFGDLGSGRRFVDLASGHRVRGFGFGSQGSGLTQDSGRRIRV
jgi:hypothetical protein